MNSHPGTLVIGAGPAGLAVGAGLTRYRVPFIMVEQAATIASTWRRHYDRLHLHTDRRHSALPYLNFPRGTPRYPSRDQMVAYLEAYARHFHLVPHLGERAISVRRCDSGWLTTTSLGTYRTRNVVVATGYNAKPTLPHLPGRDAFAGQVLHSSQYHNGEPFRGQRVLVVGLGNSGAEIATDLLEHGAEVTLAVRGGVNIVPREILGLPVLNISIALNRLPPRLADRVAAPLVRLTLGNVGKLGLRRAGLGPISQIKTTGRVPVIDVGVVSLIRKGRIGLAGAIRSLKEGGVVFEDGSVGRFDAVVLATGYRAGLEDFLQVPATDVRAMAVSQDQAGLHFCGFLISPTGMLRDIAIEARHIAERIASER